MLSSEDQTWYQTVAGLGSTEGGKPGYLNRVGEGRGREQGRSQLNVEAEVAANE